MMKEVASIDLEYNDHGLIIKQDNLRITDIRSTIIISLSCIKSFLFYTVKDVIIRRI